MKWGMIPAWRRKPGLDRGNPIDWRGGWTKGLDPFRHMKYTDSILQGPFPGRCVLAEMLRSMALFRA